MGQDILTAKMKLSPLLKRTRRILNISEWSEKLKASPNIHFGRGDSYSHWIKLKSMGEGELHSAQKTDIRCSPETRCPFPLFLAFFCSSFIPWLGKNSSVLSEIWRKNILYDQKAANEKETGTRWIWRMRGGRREPDHTALGWSRILHFILSANGSHWSILRKEWCNLI